MKEREYLIILYDFYSELLNDKQRQYFEDYYFNNLSLGEISENENVSRNAIHKNIKAVENKLYFYEEKLKLYQKSQELTNIANTIEDKNLKERIKNIL
ncbi:MAG: YlxM family DNA-binding protein [Bacilli bacterium]